MVSIVRSRLMTNIAFLAGGVLFLFGLFIGAIWLFQERIAFQPERGPFPLDAGVPRVEYTAADGQRLFAYVVGDPVAAPGLLIVFHGNADLAVRQVEWANEVVRRTGIAVMLTEYRGYMGLGGKPTYEGSRLDAEAAYRYATDNFRVPPQDIAFFGHSLGTAIAAELATRHRPDRPATLVLQSPFTSAREMSSIIIGRRPADLTWKIVSRLHFDTRTHVASLDAPVSVSHGDADRIIPPGMGYSVFNAAKIKGAWLLVSGGSHNDVEQRGGEAYWSWIVSALEPLRAAAPTH
jgi:uncharacterized protein